MYVSAWMIWFPLSLGLWSVRESGLANQTKSQEPSLILSPTRPQHLLLGTSRAGNETITICASEPK